jgi:acyl-CoA synthetase (AMP-forming)/AMP-acid ligase II
MVGPGQDGRPGRRCGHDGGTRGGRRSPDDGRTFLENADALAGRPFLRFYRDGAWQRLTWEGSRDQVLRMAAALVAEGVEPGDRVAVMSENRADWLLADLGIQAAGAVTVPLYPSRPPAWRPVAPRPAAAHLPETVRLQPAPAAEQDLAVFLVSEPLD